MADGIVASGTASRAVRPARTTVDTDLEPFFALLAAVRRVAAPETVKVLQSAGG